MRLGPSAQRRLAVVLEDLLGEAPPVVDDVAAYFDTYLHRMPFFTAFGLRFMVWALLWLPILFVLRPVPASSLTPEVRQRYLAAWAHSRFYLVREGVFLVKAVALQGWGAHPVVRARLGIPGVAAERSAA